MNNILFTPGSKVILGLKSYTLNHLVLDKYEYDITTTFCINESDKHYSLESIL